jgi:cell division transport system permease protein
MALRVDYVLRETATNLRRNVTLTVASIVTIGVSLALFGGTLLLNWALGNATQRWQGGIEFIVYMQPDVSADQRASILKALQDNPSVKDVRYVDQDKTYTEFKQLFRDQPELVNNVRPEILPPSYRVIPTTKDPEQVKALGDVFSSKAGVREVTFAYDTIKALKSIFGKIGARLFGASVTLLAAALLLILNTIRVAMFARRREIEVMKLVGATNWFIRVPFIVEGVTQALLGSAFAIGGLFAARSLIQGLDDKRIAIFSNFIIHDSQMFSACFIVVFVGILVGAAGSAFAATRFLDV